MTLRSDHALEQSNHSDQASLGRPSMSNVSAADVYVGSHL